MKILVTRTDRLGDLVLSLPVFAAGRAVRPDWEFHALVAPSSVPLVEHAPDVAAVWTWSEDDDEAEQSRLIRRLKSERYDAALMLQFRAPLARLLRKAGIRRRYGPLSKVQSWLLLNRGVRQRRSHGGRHEMDFNLDLLRQLIGSPIVAEPPQLNLSVEQVTFGHDLRQCEAPEARVVAFVHPGSGGSALDWDPARFAGVANALAGLPGWKVFVTGSGADGAAVEGMRRAGLDDRIGILLDRFALRDFLGVMAAGDVLIGPSTGPLHLAAALGLATVGIYPPVPAMSPARWGQRGRWNRILVPEVSCPGRHACLQRDCPLYNCLTGVSTDQVVTAARSAVGERDGVPAPRIRNQSGG